jgi:multidrug efflux pump subunit AcrB
LVEAILKLPEMVENLEELVGMLTVKVVGEGFEGSPGHQSIPPEVVVPGGKRSPKANARGAVNGKLTAEQAEEIRRKLKGTHAKTRRAMRRELAAELGVSLRQVAAASAYLTGALARKHKRVELRKQQTQARLAAKAAATTTTKRRTTRRK